MHTVQIGGKGIPSQHHKPNVQDRLAVVQIRCEAKARRKRDSKPNAIIQPSLVSKVGSQADTKLRTSSVELSSTQDVEHGSPAVANKAELVVVRTDGNTCQREAVNGIGSLLFECTSTHQHMLVWKTRPKRVMLIKKSGDELIEEFFNVLDFLGHKENMEVVVEPEMYWRVVESHPEMGTFVYTYANDQIHRLGEYIDFVACLGGDGVILHASHLFRQSIPPVISFHLGSLGFLTNHMFEDYQKDLQDVIYGCADTSPCRIPGSFSAGVLITLRMRLLCEVTRKGQSEPTQTHEVLNEVVVDRGSSPYLTNVECYERGRMITRVQADGIILATPTGSTAYSVAAGGSMVHPNVPAMLLTPICPHSLTFRPVVLPDYADVELKIPDKARSTGWVSFDGRDMQELHAGDRIRVRMSRYPVPTISKEDQTGDWFDSLEKCFGWNERVEQRPLRSSA